MDFHIVKMCKNKVSTKMSKIFFYQFQEIRIIATGPWCILMHSDGGTTYPEKTTNMSQVTDNLFHIMLCYIYIDIYNKHDIYYFVHENIFVVDDIASSAQIETINKRLLISYLTCVLSQYMRLCIFAQFWPLTGA
jgi:hypothetical protein